MKTNVSAGLDEVTETVVADYLRAHPDFLHRFPELATELTLPHPRHEKTVSLTERQLGLLREQKLELKHKLQHLAQVARANELLLERLQKVILELIDSADLAAALDLLEQAMRRDFHADAVTVWLFGATPANGFVARDEAGQLFHRLLEDGRPACGALRAEQMNALFGGRTDLASAALIPLCESEAGECLGLVGIGSVDPKHYHPEMGTVFLAHLGAVAARVIRARLAHGA
jgi:hypothetical protein